MKPFDIEEFRLSAIRGVAQRQGKKLVFIPVGSHGGYKLMSPDTKLPHPRAFAGIFQAIPPRLVQVKVGLPITEEALEQMVIDTGETPNVILAKAIADLLPLEAQGVYKETLPRSGTIFSRAVDLFRRGS